MISNRYKKEIWYKFLEVRYPKIAIKLDEAYLNMESQPHNSCNSLRILFEEIIQTIGEKKGEKSLFKASKDKGIKYNPLSNKLDLLKKLRLLDPKTHKELYRVREYLNDGVHDGDDSYIDFLPNIFLETIIFIKWFIRTFEDLEEFRKEFEKNKENNKTNSENEETEEDDDNTKVRKIKFCSNIKQCGRSYADFYAHNFCIKCAAPIEEIEEIIEDDDDTPEIDNKDNDIKHYLSIGELIKDGDEEVAAIKTQIELGDSEIVLGRVSSSSDYVPDIDLSKYVDEEKRKYISKKHVSIYKKDDKYYVENISKGNYVLYDFIGSDGELYEKCLDENKSIELKNELFIKISSVAFIQYISR